MSAINRQIKDIQVQADRIIKNRSSMEEIEQFHIYNEELKSYLLEHISEAEFASHVMEIPKVLDESINQVIRRGIFGILTSYLIAPLSAYFQERQSIENAKGNIQEVLRKYATIEFLLRNISDEK